MIWGQNMRGDVFKDRCITRILLYSMIVQYTTQSQRRCQRACNDDIDDVALVKREKQRLT